ncbi:MAG: hypothetical protein IPL28_13475 [Chloroflexi bacterium]|nr:hypothetical protein [Chloroflexota bacterium]
MPKETALPTTRSTSQPRRRKFMKSFARFTFLLSLLGFIGTLVGGHQPVYAAPLDGPGDIAFIALNADVADAFSFVIFENIDAGQIVSLMTMNGLEPP